MAPNLGNAQQVHPIFTKLLAQAVYAGRMPIKGREAREWFRQQATKSKVAPHSILEQSTSRMVERPIVGNMYLFNYDPKWKQKLPYYDTYPIIFMIGKAKKGFLGINLHYLPPQFRAALMDQLYPMISDKNFAVNARLQGLSYAKLRDASRYKYFRPCVKHYLFSHVRSGLMKVHPAEWPLAPFLPLARFKKAHINKVYADSRAKANARWTRRS
jgi:hypothetical protein